MEKSALQVNPQYYAMTVADVITIAESLIEAAKILKYKSYHNTVYNAYGYFMYKKNVPVAEAEGNDGKVLTELVNKLEVILLEFATADFGKIKEPVEVSKIYSNDCIRDCFINFVRTHDADAYLHCLRRCRKEGTLKVNPAEEEAWAAYMFQQVRYGGRGLIINFNEEIPDLSAYGFDNTASSIKLNPNWKVITADKPMYGGERLVITNDVPDLRATPIGGNSISSIIAVPK